MRRSLHMFLVSLIIAAGSEPVSGADAKPDATLVVDTEVYVLAISPDGGTLGAGLDNGSVHLWDTKEWKPSGRRACHSKEVRSLIVFDKGKEMLSAGAEGEVALWDRTKDSVSRTKVDTTATAFSRLGRKFVAKGGEHITLFRVNREGGKCSLLEHAVFSFPNGHVPWTLCFSDDERHVVSGGMDNSVVVWRVANAKRYVLDPGRGDGMAPTIEALTFSQSGSMVGAGGSDGHCRVWDLVTGKNLADLADAGSGGIGSLVFVDGDKGVVTASADGRLRYWDLEKRKRIASAKAHDAIIWKIVRLPGGRVATCGDDRRVRVWSLDQIKGN